MTKQTQNGGIGFFGLLFITFFVLKLTSVISWSWWWITAPLWAPALCGLLFGGGLLLYFSITKTNQSCTK